MIRKAFILALGLSLPFAMGEAYLQVFDPYHYGENEDWTQYGSKIMDQAKGQLRPGSKATYLAQPTVISRQGWRSPEFELQKPADVYRILIVGGSVPYGWGVAEGDEFPRVLERELNARKYAGNKRVEIINTGVPGWNLPEVAKLLQGEAFTWQPDMVMLLLVATDVPRSQPAARSFWLNTAMRRCRLLRAIENRYVFGTPGSGGRPSDAYENLPAHGLAVVAEALALFAGVCREHSALPVVIDTLNSEITRQRCASLGLDRVEAYTSWALRRSWEVAVTDAHPNAVGHRYYADLILENLPNR